MIRVHRSLTGEWKPSHTDRGDVQLTMIQLYVSLISLRRLRLIICVHVPAVRDTGTERVYFVNKYSTLGRK